jgi:hypothetical protein
MNIYILSSSIDPDKGSEYRLAYLNLSFILLNNNDKFNIFLITPEFENNIVKLNYIFSKYKNFKIIKVNYCTYGYLLHNKISRRIIYKIWHLNVLFKLFKDKKSIDVIHHLNTINYDSISLYFLINKKFIWGPIDGGSFIHFKSYTNFSVINKIKFTLLNYANQLNFYFNPFFRLNLFYAHTIFSSTLNMQKKILNIYNSNKIIYMPDTGSNFIKLDIIKKIRNIDSVKIIFTWIGQDISRKNFKYLFDIIKQVNTSNIFFNIIGIEKSYEFYDSEIVKFHGIIEHNSIEKILLNTHFLISTSIRDSNTSSAFEAFDMLVPTICPLQIGFADIIFNHKLGITYDLCKKDSLINIINKLINMDDCEFQLYYLEFLKNMINSYDILSYNSKAKKYLNAYSK